MGTRTLHVQDIGILPLARSVTNSTKSRRGRRASSVSLSAIRPLHKYFRLQTAIIARHGIACRQTRLFKNLVDRSKSRSQKAILYRISEIPRQLFHKVLVSGIKRIHRVLGKKRLHFTRVIILRQIVTPQHLTVTREKICRALRQMRTLLKLLHDLMTIPILPKIVRHMIP